MSSGAPSRLVSFPTSDSAPVAPLPVPHLPFRRISLPTTPSPALAAHRQSVVSLASFDSLAEEPVAVNQHRRARRRSLNPSSRPHKRTHADDDRQAKRSKVVSEFFATEKSYLDGLDIVYNHFLTPILQSLDTSKPLLTRNEITTLFSNFIDIWNFHHTFFAALSARLNLSAAAPNHNTPLSSLLLSHFPYLSLYTPFITAFPTALDFLTSLTQPSTPTPAFAAFLRAQESHSICAHLRLADYLLTPVQRCPRYLLLLKDLLNSTDPDDSEWERLQEVRALVEKITTSLNTALAAHAQTLELISLQRNTRDLPPALTPLVAPGRQFIKRGVLIRSGGESNGPGRKSFEFLLLSDYLLWFEREEAGMGVLAHDGGSPSPRRRRVSMNALGSNDEEKWWCRGYMSLIDMEVVMVADRPGVGPGAEGEERVEVLSPEGSFALFPGPSPASPDDPNSLSAWVDAIRTTRATCLAALALANPDSTLSASTSGVHLRRVLRAFASESDDVDNEQRVEETGDGSTTLSPSSKSPRSHLRRAQLDNFLPPIWIPDAKTDTCMRCGRPFGFVLDLRLGEVFGWGFGRSSGNDSKKKSETEREDNESKRAGGGGAWRRKHHCRLCGRVVCAACSGKTFYIANDDGNVSPTRKKQRPKPARACDECYESAFPLIPPSPIDPVPFSPASSGTQRSSTPHTPSDPPSTPRGDEDPETIRGIQPWLSIPSRQGAGKDVSETLMSMDLGPGAIAMSRSPSRTGLSASPSRVVLSSSPSRKSKLSASPSKPNSGLRETYANVHGLSGSPSPSRRVVHLPRISSGDSDPLSPRPISSSSQLVLQIENASSEGVYDDGGQEEHEHVPTRPIRVRSSQTRPRSYHDILEDFSMHERGISIPSSVSSAPGAGLSSLREGDDEEGGGGEGKDDVEHEGEGGIGFELDLEEGEGGLKSQSPTEDHNGAAQREDTARRRKRFSLPAVALQTAPVFARSRQSEGRRVGNVVEDDTEGNRSERRRSLVHGGERIKNKRERQGEKESSAVGLLMEVLKGRVKYPGRN